MDLRVLSLKFGLQMLCWLLATEQLWDWAQTGFAPWSWRSWDAPMHSPELAQACRSWKPLAWLESIPSPLWFHPPFTWKWSQAASSLLRSTKVRCHTKYIRNVTSQIIIIQILRNKYRGFCPSAGTRAQFFFFPAAETLHQEMGPDHLMGNGDWISTRRGGNWGCLPHEWLQLHWVVNCCVKRTECGGGICPAFEKLCVPCVKGSGLYMLSGWRTSRSGIGLPHSVFPISYLKTVPFSTHWF